MGCRRPRSVSVSRISVFVAESVSWRELIEEAQKLEDASKGGSISSDEPPAMVNGASEAGGKPGSNFKTSPEESISDALETVRLRQQMMKLDQRAQDMKLRKHLAGWAIGFVAAQLLAASLFFGWYLWHNAQKPEVEIMVAWLSATVVEVIGILWVIARSLFPYKDKRVSSEEPKKTASARQMSKLTVGR